MEMIKLFKKACPQKISDLFDFISIYYSIEFSTPLASSYIAPIAISFIPKEMDGKSIHKVVVSTNAKTYVDSHLSNPFETVTAKEWLMLYDDISEWLRKEPISISSTVYRPIENEELVNYSCKDIKLYGVANSMNTTSLAVSSAARPLTILSSIEEELKFRGDFTVDIPKLVDLLFRFGVIVSKEED